MTLSQGDLIDFVIQIELHLLECTNVIISYGHGCDSSLEVRPDAWWKSIAHGGDTL
jgi:hypothetical protein